MFQKHENRAEFDRVSQELQKTGQRVAFNLNQVNTLARQLVNFYNEDTDGERLAWMCQWLMKHRDSIAGATVDKHNTLMLYQMQRLLVLCCRQLSHIASSSQPLSISMRVLEVYLDAGVYEKLSPGSDAAPKLLLYVVKTGHYFRCLRHVLEARVPDSLNRSVTPPTPMAASVLDLIQKPLHIITTLKEHNRSTILECLCKEMFCCQFSVQIKEFLLPALAYGRHPFPFLALLNTLLPLYSQGLSNSAKLFESQPEMSKSAAERYKAISVADRQQEQHKKQLQQDEQSLEPSVFLFYALLHLANRCIAKLSPEAIQQYTLVLYALAPSLQQKTTLRSRGRATLQPEPDESDEEGIATADVDGLSIAAIQAECCALLDEADHVSGVLAAVENKPSSHVTMAISTVGHWLMRHTNMPVHKSRLLYSLAYKPSFLRSLWHTIVRASISTVTGGQTSLLNVLSRGLDPGKKELASFIPLLSMFCSLFSYSLVSLHDADFFGDDTLGDKSSANDRPSFQPFTLKELVGMSRALLDAALGIIELAHPDSLVLNSTDISTLQPADLQYFTGQRQQWSKLFKEIVTLGKQLYARDSRRRFCPENHWLTIRHGINPDRKSHLYRPNVFQHRQFASLSVLNPNRMQVYEEEACSPLSTKEVRQLSVLQEIPFVIPYEVRCKIFQNLVQAEHGYMEQSSDNINIRVRRSFLYEDAFEKLSPENAPNLQHKIKVTLKNFAGMTEAGIDGGGLFREFLTELLKTGFDPNRGFFCYTSDKLLYPNPNAKAVAEDYMKHYYFLGRILGKALYENLLVELPFASFFLSKILSCYRGDVDIHHLASLDPSMYKNLLYLKAYEGDVSEFGLDFTVINNTLGEVQTEELKSGGREIPVTKSNRIEYIHLMADYRLNKQIRHQVTAFREGLASVLRMDWLRMFNSAELQVLISGAPVPIDVKDLKEHTSYLGGYSENHHVIKTFWTVVEKFTDEQRKKLLKFVTSCSKPPMLGFKDLDPPFTITSGGKDLSRLPTASTCMNLLKLPEFKDEKMMAEKLTYSLEAEAGFELS